MKNFTGFACVALLLSGCATATRGTSADVTIEFEPKNAKVVTSLGHACQANPCTINVSRKKSFTVTGTADGFEQQTVEVNTRVAGEGFAAGAGSALLGGVIGLTVDAVSGATLEHFPNPVQISLKPEGSSSEAPETVSPEAQGEPTS